MSQTPSTSPWQVAIADLEEMLGDGRKKRSRSIIEIMESMRDWIEEHEHVTEKQLAAIRRFQNFGQE